MLTALFSIWTLVTFFIFYHDNRCAKKKYWTTVCYPNLFTQRRCILQLVYIFFTLYDPRRKSKVQEYPIWVLNTDGNWYIINLGLTIHQHSTTELKIFYIKPKQKIIYIYIYIISKKVAFELVNARCNSVFIKFQRHETLDILLRKNREQPHRQIKISQCRRDRYVLIPSNASQTKPFRPKYRFL